MTIFLVVVSQLKNKQDNSNNLVYIVKMAIYTFHKNLPNQGPEYSL